MPVWKVGEEEAFLKAVNVQTVSPKYHDLKKALQAWNSIKKAVDFKLTDDETTTYTGISELNCAAATYISSYTVTLLVKSKGWAKVTPETIKLDGAAKDLHKSLEDALAASSNAEGAELDPNLTASASEKLALGRSAP